jgi:hypothetical protein
VKRTRKPDQHSCGACCTAVCPLARKNSGHRTPRAHCAAPHTPSSPSNSAKGCGASTVMRSRVTGCVNASRHACRQSRGVAPADARGGAQGEGGGGRSEAPRAHSRLGRGARLPREGQGVGAGSLAPSTTAAAAATCSGSACTRARASQPAGGLGAGIPRGGFVRRSRRRGWRCPARGGARAAGASAPCAAGAAPAARRRSAAAGQPRTGGTPRRVHHRSGLKREQAEKAEKEGRVPDQGAGAGRRGERAEEAPLGEAVPRAVAPDPHPPHPWRRRRRRRLGILPDREVDRTPRRRTRLPHVCARARARSRARAGAGRARHHREVELFDLQGRARLSARQSFSTCEGSRGSARAGPRGAARRGAGCTPPGAQRPWRARGGCPRRAREPAPAHAHAS